MTEKIGVAISTTGDPHRLGFLETCAQAWWRALAVYGLPTTVFVTVDGDEAACARAARAVAGFAVVYRVGQPTPFWGGPGTREGRCGVATNKNTGLELLMDACVSVDRPDIEHLFLSDDDTWPLNPTALDLHFNLGARHSMLAWGGHRLEHVGDQIASWSWPRGSMLYVTRDVLVKVGGMDERFGPGGHEHVEWSRRIHQAGLTPSLFCSPHSYATNTRRGSATGAANLWHAEDMRRPGEPLSSAKARRRRLTSVRRTDADWPHIDKIMAERDGDVTFTPFRAHGNGRASATLCTID